MFKTGRALPNLYTVVDITVLNVAFFGSIYFFKNLLDISAVEWSILLGLVLLWFGISKLFGLYKYNLHNGISARMLSYIRANVIFAVNTLVFAFVTTKFSLGVGKTLLAFVIAFLVLDIIVNFIIISFISSLRRNQFNTKYTLVAGVGDLAQQISKHFTSNPDYGYQIKGYLSCNGEEVLVNDKKVVGTLGDMKSYLGNNAIDEVVIALPSYESSQTRIKSIIQEADYQGVRVSWVPDYHGLFGNNFETGQYGRLDVVNVNRFPLDGIFSAVVKEIFDFVFASTVILLLSPVYLIIAALIKLDTPGSAFYCPVRVGKGGKKIKVFKFRTMSVNDAAEGGALSTQKDDARITRVGKILRKYSLDELPQFFNVFLGSMSVVGPRPHRNFLNQQMKEKVDKYMLRHYFKPGITGWAQVNGWRGPTSTEEQINQRTAHDLWYIEKWSFVLDIKIIWLTIFSSKVHKNAF